MEISSELNEVLIAAYREAESRSHEYLTPEHVLYAALFFDRGRQVVSSCGGDVAGLTHDIEDFFSRHVPVVDSSKPVQSAGFQEVMERAILHTASAQKDTVQVDDILASIMEERESFAAHFLARQGIDRLSLLSYISHGVTAYPDEEQDAGEAGGQEAGSRGVRLRARRAARRRRARPGRDAPWRHSPSS